jgi:hypothetical protein
VWRRLCWVDNRPIPLAKLVGKDAVIVDVGVLRTISSVISEETSAEFRSTTSIRVFPNTTIPFC